MPLQGLLSGLKFEFGTCRCCSVCNLHLDNLQHNQSKDQTYAYSYQRCFAGMIPIWIQGSHHFTPFLDFYKKKPPWGLESLTPFERMEHCIAIIPPKTSSW